MNHIATELTAATATTPAIVPDTYRSKSQQHKNTMSAAPAFTRLNDLLRTDAPGSERALSNVPACGAVRFCLRSAVIRRFLPSWTRLILGIAC
jgi:hypothetical protein